jgi:3-oxoacyl-[acyl-carrier protein] reductase
MDEKGVGRLGSAGRGPRHPALGSAGRGPRHPALGSAGRGPRRLRPIRLDALVCDAHAMTPTNEDRTAVVLGARNLGGAILDHLVANGWKAAAVARSGETVAKVRERGAVGLMADASDPSSLRTVLASVRHDLGPPRLIVNAVSASRPPDDGAGFGGGPIADATLQGFHGWAAAVAEQAFVFLSMGIDALRESGGGTLVQITGGSARRAMPGRGLWSAGAQATRAMVHAAAQELREEGIHVALLIVDATIESPKTAGYTRDAPESALADQRLIAEAVEFLANQQPRAYTHELMVTPAGDRWVP